MIPKRENHMLTNLIAAAPVRTYGDVFAEFCFVTDYAAKYANLRFMCVTIKWERNGVGGEMVAGL